MATSTGFKRSTLKELRERAMAEIDAKLPDVDARLRHSVLNVVSCILADMTNELYGYLDFIARQIFPDLAESEFLEQWGGIWGINRKLASFATGNITVKGVFGSSLVSGTQFRRGNGTIYLTTESVVIPESGSILVPVKSENVGYDSNANPGVKLSLLSPVAGITSEAVIDSNGLTGGAPREEDESYRDRIIQRIQEPPRGGSRTDYEQWTLEVSGVTRAWCYPTEMGAGTVGIRFMMDETYPDGIPQAGDIQRVLNHLNDENRKPVTAEIFVNAPEPYVLDIYIEDLSPDTPETRAAIEAELKDLFAREAYPGCTVYVSRLWEAISIATGTEHFDLSYPSTNIVMEPFAIPILGTVHYNEGGPDGD